MSKTTTNTFTNSNNNEESIRLRLRNPNVMHENVMHENVEHEGNLSYINSTSIDPWPLSIVRPSLEEIRRARVAEFSNVNAAPTNLNSMNEVADRENLTIGMHLPDAYFESPVLTFVGEQAVVVAEIRQGILNLSEAEILSEAMLVTENVEPRVGQSRYISTHEDRIALARLLNNDGVVNNPDRIASFQRFGASSINVPRYLSRHEMVISLFFSLLSNEVFRHISIIIFGGSFSAVFILFLFRRILISVLNPSFWFSIRIYEIPDVLRRALNNSQRFSFYRSLPTSADVNNILIHTTEDLRNNFRLRLRGFRRGNYFNFFVTSLPVIGFGISLFIRAGGFRNLPFLPGSEVLVQLARNLSVSNHNLPSNNPVNSDLATLVVDSVNYIQIGADMLDTFHAFFLNYF